MVLAALILMLATALFLFYLQVTCQRILRQQFNREYFLSIVNANRLEFPELRRALGDFHAPVDYTRLRIMLKRDFLALTFLLKNAVNVKQRYSREEWSLTLYFRLIFASLTILHWLRAGEKPAMLKLTTILRYFANVVGQRTDTIRFANRTDSDYFPDL